MKRIGLIACSKSKLKEAERNPKLEVAAKDMYTGPNYRKALHEGLNLYHCDSYYILSGKYGLLQPDDKVQYYDCYLGKKGMKYRKEWSEKVYKALCEKTGNPDENEYIFFAPKAYCEHLLPRLPHRKAMKYNGRQITFEERMF